QLRRAIHAFCRCLEIASGRLIDARHEFLGISIDDREPSRLNLYHDSVPFQKYVIVIAQRDDEFGRLIGHKRLWSFVTLVEASPADFGRNWQFVSIERIGVFAGLRS